MTSLRDEGRFALEHHELALLRKFFDAGRASEEETIAEIRRLEAATGYVADPHTAVGTAVAARVKRDPEVPMITLATAHPAKFPDAIAKAIGRPPAVPELVARQSELPERINRVPGDIAKIAELIEAKAVRRRSV